MRKDGGTVGFTIRLDGELLKILRFIAADKETSINNLMVEFLAERASQYRISFPNGLLLEQEAVEATH
jgi:hypothetical protein